MLGHENSQIDKRILFGFEIYIHEKGQFWPKPGMCKIGQSDKIEMELNEEMEIAFSQREISNLYNSDRKCNEDTNFSITKCLENYIKRKTNCQVDWCTDGQDDKSCIS